MDFQSLKQVDAREAAKKHEERVLQEREVTPLF